MITWWSGIFALLVGTGGQCPFCGQLGCVGGPASAGLLATLCAVVMSVFGIRKRESKHRKSDKRTGSVKTMQEGFYGRITDPSAVGVLTGPCGDTVEFYLVIKNRIITRVQYITDGCQHTRLCGGVVACYAQGAPITMALGISARQVLHELPQLPKEHRHCALLAVSAFYSAVGQYWVSQAGV